MVDATTPRTIKIDKKKISSGTQGKVVVVEIFICFVTDNFNIPSFCGIFVSRLITSIETRNVRFFTFVFSMKGMISVILILVVYQLNKLCKAQNLKVLSDY